MWESQFTMAGSCRGYLLVGEMLNHNDYYPEAYSQNVVHSFLTISANTTRVCSNLPESDTHYLGTEIPAVVQQAAAESGNYFGSEQAPIGGNYFFRYQALTIFPARWWAISALELKRKPIPACSM